MIASTVKAQTIAWGASNQMAWWSIGTPSPNAKYPPWQDIFSQIWPTGQTNGCSISSIHPTQHSTPYQRSQQWIWQANMTPRHGTLDGEDHHHACHAQTMEPPTMMEPVPSLDEEISHDPCHQDSWGHHFGKNKKAPFASVFRMLVV